MTDLPERVLVPCEHQVGLAPAFIAEVVAAALVPET